MAPAPLVPPDCDLRGLPYMPLEVLRLRDSDLALLASGDEFKASVLLWCAAWHQTPGGSLPSDDRVLNRLSGLDAKTWKRARKSVLAEWIECSDGRLYHPVVAQKAVEAWEERQKFREKRGQDRARLSNWRDAKRAKNGDRNASETPGETPSETPGETRFTAVSETPSETSKKGREGKRREGISSEPNGSAPSEHTEAKASAEPAPFDPGRDCWRAAKLLLEERHRMTADAAGRFFGKLLSDYGLEAKTIFPAVIEATNNGTEDVKGYLVAAAQSRSRRSGVAPKQVDAEWC